MIICLEFPCRLTVTQVQQVDAWLSSLKVLYNHALARLLDWDEFTGYYCKETKSYNPCCPLPWEYRWDAESESLVPFSRIMSPRSRWYVKALPRHRIKTSADQKDAWGWECVEGGSGYSCPLPTPYAEPLLKRWELKATGGLGLVAKGDYWPADSSVLAVPYKFRAGALTMLETPWQEYMKSRYGKGSVKRGRPKFKRQRDDIRALIHANPKQVIVPDGNGLKGVPKLGRIVVRGLSRRWRNPDGTIPEISTFKIIKRQDRYYVQLTGDLQRTYPVKDSDRAVGIDPGLVWEVATSDGLKVAAARRYRQGQKRRAQLQRQIAHKRSHNLVLWLHHPDRILADVKALVPFKAEDWDTLRCCKTEQALIDLLGASRVNTLKFGIPVSKAIARLELLEKRHEARIARSRKAADDKLTSRLVRDYGYLAMEDGLQHEKMRKRAKAKPREGGEGYEQNGAKRKSGLSKSLADAAPGRKLALLERKAKRSDRVFDRVAAKDTSRACPVCGAIHPPDYEERVFKCLDCGWTGDRDESAAVNIELVAFALTGAQLTPSAHRARAYGCFWMEADPKGRKPLWAKGVKPKKVSDFVAEIRALYSGAVWGNFKLQFQQALDAQAAIRANEPGKPNVDSAVADRR